jgi:hypothetical protein
MNPVLDNYLKDIENARTFTGESYLETSLFMIFLLFGCDEEQRRVLSTKANRLIKERRAFAMIDAAEPDLAAAVRKAVDEASENQISLRGDLNEIHICPLIISDNADASSYRGIIGPIETYFKEQEIRVEWKAFLLLSTDPQKSALWVDAVSENIKELGGNNTTFGNMHSCRCCILTFRNEDNFEVVQERLLTTVLFVAFLNNVKETRESIGRHMSIDPARPEDLFYTAQTAFIENPIIPRIFKRMSGLLERLCRPAGAKKEIDMGFMNPIIKSRFDKMPRERDGVSLLPLYAIIPGADLRARIGGFMREHYLDIGEKEKDEVYNRIMNGFLASFMMSGHDADDLIDLIGNENKIRNLLENNSLESTRINALPAYPGKYYPEIYAEAASTLQNRLSQYGKSVIAEYFKSPDFTGLPKKFQKALDKLNKIIISMKELSGKHSKMNITLPLLDDPDESWVSAESNAQNLAERFIKSFSFMALTDSDDMCETEMGQLLDDLYKEAKSLSGGNSEKSYMNLVSATCQDINSDVAKSCVAEIEKALLFPIRLRDNTAAMESVAYFWGSKENNLYSVWDRYNKKSSELRINSNERFALLRMSDAFGRDKIKSIRTETAQRGGEADVNDCVT